MNDNKQAMQDIYNRACAGVIAQGVPARAANGGSCQYRLPYEGGVLKCAIGHVLTDEQIKKYGVQESTNPHRFAPELLAELLPGMFRMNAQLFLVELQQCHDMAGVSTTGTFLEGFKKRAYGFARHYGLIPIAC